MKAALDEGQARDLSGEAIDHDTGFSWAQVRHALTSPHVIIVSILL